MRILLKAKFDHEKFNQAVRDGSAATKIKRILEELKPEATYFTAENGKRCGIFIINVDEPSKIPSFAEPFFLFFNADCDFNVVMRPEDLDKSGLAALGKKWAS